MIHFVGAGPGAPDLITVRGAEYLRQADVIIYAGSLVNPELLAYAGDNCRIYNSAHMTLDEVIRVMRDAQEQDLAVVRLHTGDPALYGAIREQMDALDVLGIPYDVCPGVSSLFGAAAALRCEYTLPEVSQSVIVTRAEGRTAVPEREKLRELAVHQATMILFLSSGLSRQVRDELIAGGYAPNTPVAVVYKATWPDEKIVHTTISALPEDMEREHIDRTALIVVGNVLNSGYEKSKLYDANFSTGYRHTGNKKILMIACSKKGYDQMNRLRDKMSQPGEEWSDAEFICRVKCRALPDESIHGSIEHLVEAYFGSVDAIVFFSASGIAVRSIAPFVRHKAEDPAVVVVDESARYCVSLLSGHAGGANALAQKIAAYTGAEPVVTTATDREGAFAVDEFARKNGLVVTDWKLAREISVSVLEGKQIRLISEYMISGRCPELVQYMTTEEVTAETSYNMMGNTYSVLISPYEMTEEDEEKWSLIPGKLLALVPRQVVVGIGCRKGIPYENIHSAVMDCLRRYRLRQEAVCAVTSIDLKQNEPGILQFCEEQGVPFVTYGQEELQEAEGTFSVSDFVEHVTGVDCVCERSAVLYAQGDSDSLICRKTVCDGVTVAFAMCGTDISFD